MCHSLSSPLYAFVFLTLFFSFSPPPYVDLPSPDQHRVSLVPPNRTKTTYSSAFCIILPCSPILPFSTRCCCSFCCCCCCFLRAPFPSLLLQCLTRTSISGILSGFASVFCLSAAAHSFIRYGRAATKRELPPFCAL